MKTVQVTIDEELLAKVDGLVAKLGTTRSAFMRDALKTAVRRETIRQMEKEHEEAYARQPQNLAEEIEPWEAIQEWGDDWAGEYPTRASEELRIAE